MRALNVAVVVSLCVVRSVSAAENDCDAAGKAAEQLRGSGDLAGARGRLAGCLSPLCSAKVQGECARLAAAIEAKMSVVVLEAKDEGGSDMSGVHTTMDGAPVADHTPIFVNPGEHRVVFESPGFRRIETTVVAGEPQKRYRVLVFLVPAPMSMSASAGATGTAPAPGMEGHDQRRTFASGGRQKLALGLGLVGVAGAAVGTTLSLMSKSTYDHALSTECGGDPHQCSAEGTADGKTAHRQAAIATVGFVAAGVFLAAGAVLYFTGPKQTVVAVAPALDPSGAVKLVGTW